MSQPAQPLDLDAIETRAAYLDEYALLADEPLQADLDQLTGTDVPAMAAELRQARAEIHRLRDERDRYRTAWRLARTRALSTGGAADRYAARAREGQTALQDMLGALFAAQMERDEALARVAALEAVLAGRPAEPAAVETHVVADDSSDPEHTDDCPGCPPAGRG